MTIKELQKIAKKRGVKATNLKKRADIIRVIQHAEGNFDCFGTAIMGICDQYKCLWRVDCLKIKA